MKFRTYINEREKQDLHNLLKTKHDFMIRSQSQKKLRVNPSKLSVGNSKCTDTVEPRDIQTSHEGRKQLR